MSEQRRSPRVAENNAITENEILKQRLAECERDQLDTLIIMIKQKQQEMVDDGKLMSDVNVPGLQENLSKFSSAGREYFYAKMGLDLPMTDEEIEDHFHKMDMSKGGKRRKSSRKHRKKKSVKSRSRSRRTRKKTSKKSKTQKRFPIKYLPNKLTKKDRKKQKKELLKSQEDYKKGIYHTREKVKSYDVKPSKYVVQAKKMYDIDNVKPSKELAKKTGCSIKGLNEIVKKGQGAYYSSGSRPNQSGHSWGIARMASVITGNKAAAVDFHIVEKYCDKTKKGYKTALKGKKKHGRGTRKVRKVT